VKDLVDGIIHWFREWPTGDVPRAGAIVYTIWDRQGSFIYAGMSGRGDSKKGGPWGRLKSHSSGRRSGNQFCIYVCDRLVLPGMHNRLGEVADGQYSLDEATRDFIRENLGFRWVAVADGSVARKLEEQLKRGEASCGRPLLNPLGPKEVVRRRKVGRDIV
jgi:hypothetical protein